MICCTLVTYKSTELKDNLIQNTLDTFLARWKAEEPAGHLITSRLRVATAVLGIGDMTWTCYFLTFSSSAPRVFAFIDLRNIMLYVKHSLSERRKKIVCQRSEKWTCVLFRGCVRRPTHWSFVLILLSWTVHYVRLGRVSKDCSSTSNGLLTPACLSSASTTIFSIIKKKHQLLFKDYPATNLVTPFSTGTHSYHGFGVRLGDFISIRKGLWWWED